MENKLRFGCKCGRGATLGARHTHPGSSLPETGVWLAWGAAGAEPTDRRRRFPRSVHRCPRAVTWESVRRGARLSGPCSPEVYGSGVQVPWDARQCPGPRHLPRMELKLWLSYTRVPQTPAGKSPNPGERAGSSSPVSRHRVCSPRGLARLVTFQNRVVLSLGARLCGRFPAWGCLRVAGKALASDLQPGASADRGVRGAARPGDGPAGARPGSMCRVCRIEHDRGTRT